MLTTEQIKRATEIAVKGRVVSGDFLLRMARCNEAQNFTPLWKKKGIDVKSIEEIRKVKK